MRRVEGCSMPARPASPRAMTVDRRRSTSTSATASAWSPHGRPIISRLKRVEHPIEMEEGMVIALETRCPATGLVVMRDEPRENRDHIP